MPSEDTQFRPGNNANPNGRPRKENCFTDILKEQGNIKDADSLEGKIERKQAIAKKLWAMALGGDVAALKYVYDRVDGTPKQTILNQITEVDNPIYDMLDELITDLRGKDEDKPTG